jgi:hypothetical protein
MRQTTMPLGGDDFCGPCQGDPCSGVRSIGEILGELLGTIDVRQRQTHYEVAGPFRFTTVAGRTLNLGR